MSLERVIDGHSKDHEEVIDNTIRPKRLQDYIGQQAMREQMAIFIQAANHRREALDHVLIFGPPGSGKSLILMIKIFIIGQLEIRKNRKVLYSTESPNSRKASHSGKLKKFVVDNSVAFCRHVER